MFHLDRVTFEDDGKFGERTRSAMQLRVNALIERLFPPPSTSGPFTIDAWICGRWVIVEHHIGDETAAKVYMQAYAEKHNVATRWDFYALTGQE